MSRPFVEQFVVHATVAIETQRPLAGRGKTEAIISHFTFGKVNCDYHVITRTTFFPTSERDYFVVLVEMVNIDMLSAKA